MSLEEIALKMVAPGKGILAADESSGTIKKRFDSINVVSTDDTRACDLGHRGLAASARRAAASSIVTRSRATTSQPGCSKRLGSRVTI